MFFSLSYGVLELHFIYRYVALCYPKRLSHFGDPKWILIMISAVFGQGLLWFFSVYFLMWPDSETRSYLVIPFRRDYNADVHKIPLLASTYWGASTQLILRTSTAIIIVTLISCFTICFCIWIGWTVSKVFMRGFHSFRDVPESQELCYTRSHVLALLVRSSSS